MFLKFISNGVEEGRGFHLEYTFEGWFLFLSPFYSAKQQRDVSVRVVQFCINCQVNFGKDLCFKIISFALGPSICGVRVFRTLDELSLH